MELCALVFPSKIDFKVYIKCFCASFNLNTLPHSVLTVHRVWQGAVFTCTYLCLCLFVSSLVFTSQQRAVGLKRRRFEPSALPRSRSDNANMSMFAVIMFTVTTFQVVMVAC